MTQLLFSIGWFPVFVLGFGLGVWTYAHVYQHFLNAEEAKWTRKLSRELRIVEERRAQIEAVKNKVVATWGPDLAKEHADVIDEEVEKVLGTGPNGRNRR